MDSVSGFEPLALTSTLPVLRSPMTTGSIPVVHYSPSVVRLIFSTLLDQLVKSQLLYLWRNGLKIRRLDRDSLRQKPLLLVNTFILFLYLFLGGLQVNGGKGFRGLWSYDCSV